MTTETTLTKEQLEEFFAGISEAAYEKFGYGINTAVHNLALHGLSVLPRPIEEAPKDGEVIMGLVGDLKCQTAFWNNRWCICAPNTKAEDFWGVEPWADLGPLPFDPTHFIPLSALAAPLTTASEKK